MVRDISTINKTTGKNIPGVREAPNRVANSKIFRISVGKAINKTALYQR